ncbi:OmpA family protein [Psychrobacter sp.]|uniref:OmpA family protein n=1 Tax=Psychrobacter sp. TaxID=56811 RepID=UPI0025DD4298|nr:OmpA family protein [Psychrobacter sp.]
MKSLLSILPFTLLSCSALLTTASIQAATSSTDPTKIEFPNANKTYLKDIPRYDADDLIHINTGIDDDTVRKLIGNPHFNEFMSNNWNYILKIRQPYSREYIQCQLQLHFNKHDKVENYYWDKPQCAEAIENTLNKPKPVIVEKPTPIIEPKARTFTLSSDLLFDFNSANIKSSSAFNIDKLTATIQQDYSQIHSINVVGHTDYLGDEAYNYNLALQRANTIKDELAGRGFNPSSISTSSMGESSPLTQSCQNMSLEQTKLCLAPDRRVEVQVVGDLK